MRDRQILHHRFGGRSTHRLVHGHRRRSPGGGHSPLCLALAGDLMLSPDGCLRARTLTNRDGPFCRPGRMEILAAGSLWGSMSRLASRRTFFARFADAGFFLQPALDLLGLAGESLLPGCSPGRGRCPGESSGSARAPAAAVSCRIVLISPATSHRIAMITMNRILAQSSDPLPGPARWIVSGAPSSIVLPSVTLDPVSWVWRSTRASGCRRRYSSAGSSP